MHRTPDPLTPYGNRPMVTPIVNAVNYEYRSFDVLRQITDGEIDGYTYHRDDNPTVREVEHKIAALENAEDCVVCTSGMAACTMIAAPRSTWPTSPKSAGPSKTASRSRATSAGR